MRSLKLILFALIIYSSSNVFSQTDTSKTVPIDPDTKKITYKEVVQQVGEPGKFYNQAISWINSKYKNPEDATRVRDAANNKIEIRHRIKVYNIDKDGNKTEAAVVSYTMILEFKKDKYRYTITDYNVDRTSKFPLERWTNKNDPQYTPLCDSYISQINEATIEIIKSLKEGMKIKEIKQDNW